MNESAIREAMATRAAEMGYEKLISELSTHFGVAFRMEHTGGNCWAIVSDRLESGHVIYVTDAQDTLTPESEREEYRQQWGYPPGFGVAVYEHDDDGEEVAMVGMLDGQAAEQGEVIEMIEWALRQAASKRLRISL